MRHLDFNEKDDRPSTLLQMPDRRGQLRVIASTTQAAAIVISVSALTALAARVDLSQHIASACRQANQTGA